MWFIIQTAITLLGACLSTDATTNCLRTPLTPFFKFLKVNLGLGRIISNLLQ